MSTQNEASELQALFSYLSIVQKQNYSLVAATSFLAYDICHTFFDEVEYIWKAKWSFPKVLYILGRYYNLCYLLVMAYFSMSQVSSPQEYLSSLKASVSMLSDVLSHHRCRGFAWYMMVGGNTMSASIVNMLFCLRTFALYNGDRRVISVFVVLSSVELVAEIYSTVVAGLHISVLSVPGLTFPGCIVTSSINRESTLFAWVPNIIINSIYFMASLVKLSTYSGWRKDDSYPINDPGRPGIMTILIRDGALFYALTISVVSVSMIMTLVANARYYILATYWVNAVYSFAGAHMILNLRQAGRSTHRFTTTTVVDIPIQFRSYKRQDPST